MSYECMIIGSGTQRGICFCSCHASNVTLIFSEDLRISDQRTQHLHLQLYARVSKQLSLCHCLVNICHPFVSNLFAGEMFSTCARSLAAMSRDLAYVLNVSPVQRLESIVCKRTCHFRV